MPLVNDPSDIDPLTLALQPPPDETPQAKAERLRVEEEARRISNLIDEQIGADRTQLKKAANAYKILLLGQAESGKSTTLKS
jgi:guanine nucleotide-binding protein subunit alpha